MIARVSDHYRSIGQVGCIVPRKQALLTYVFLAGILFLSSGWAVENPGKKAPPVALQGGWKVTDLEIDGKPNELPAGASFWVVIKGDKLFYGGEELAKLTCDTTTTPPCIDLAFRKPDRVYEAVYSVEDDTLKLCVNHLTEGVRERPSGFSTEGKADWRLLVLKRDKERTIEDLEGLAGFVGVAIMFQEESKELLVKDVIAGSPAKKGDLQKDDLILKIGGQEPTDLLDSVKTIRNAKPGGELLFRIKRGGKEIDLKVKVGVAPFFLLD